MSLPWLTYFHQVRIWCIYAPINIYIKYWMGGVEKYFLKFYDICKFQKLELSTRGMGLRTPWPPRQDRHMHVPTMKNIFLCPWKENILRWWRLELFFLNNLLCHEECFFPIFRLNMFTVSCSALWILPLNAF